MAKSETKTPKSGTEQPPAETPAVAGETIGPKADTPAAPAIDTKRQAFTAAADAIVTLDKRSDQIDVLRAVANFFGLQIGELK
jgi:zona occludens toxin (predicted ATPase)